MARNANPDSLLEELTPLSESLIGTTLQRETLSRNSFFATIENEKCFIPFASKFFEGLGKIGISGTLDEIHGMATFQNLCL